MIEVIDIIILIFMIPFSWITSFLMHELMHIKSQGLRMTGTIRIYEKYLTCNADTVRTIEYIYFASGGLYSGIIFIWVGVLAVLYNAWGFYVPLISFGILNMVYGFWEGFKKINTRYYMYVITIIILIIFWTIFTIVGVK